MTGFWGEKIDFRRMMGVGCPRPGAGSSKPGAGCLKKDTPCSLIHNASLLRLIVNTIIFD